jgi:hypothetical protein
VEGTHRQQSVNWQSAIQKKPTAVAAQSSRDIFIFYIKNKYLMIIMGRIK